MAYKTVQRKQPFEWRLRPIVKVVRAVLTLQQRAAQRHNAQQARKEKPNG